jgi:myo-inositol catabolism protein IolS
MEYVTLGADGPAVSRLAFGCEPLGGTDWGQVDEHEIMAAIREAYERGVTLFDTADIYGLGASEVLLADALGDLRTRVVIATKGGVRWRCIPGDVRAATFLDTSPAEMVESLEGSLRRLRLEQIPLYQIHWPDGQTAVEDTVDALARCVESGKVRFIGCSNFSAQDLAAANRRAPLASIQLPFGLIHRDTAATFAEARRRGMTTLAYGCLAQGLLTGKYGPDAVFDADDRRSRLPHFATDQSAVRDRLAQVSRQVGRSPAQVAVRWVLDSGLVSSAIVGIKSVQQLRENLGVFDWPAGAGSLSDMLNDIGARPAPSPTPSRESARRPC